MAGRFFGFGKKKPTAKLKNTSQLSTEQADDSDDEDSYQDSDRNCPTEPPRGLIPNYPPPRPAGGSPKLNKMHNNNNRKDDYQDPWDSASKPAVNTNSMAGTSTYCDPFDSTNKPKVKPKPPFSNHVQTDYQDPFDAKFVDQMKNLSQKKESDDEEESYDQPYEPNNSTNINVAKKTDTYEDPWDTRNKNTENIVRSNTTGVQDARNKTQKVDIQQVSRSKRDDYKDPWDTKTSTSLRSSDGFDDTYSEPYDVDKMTVLDEKKRKSHIEEELDDDDDLYDFPYEEKVAIGIASAINGKESGKNFQSLPTNVRSQHKPQKPPPSRPAPYQAATQKPASNAAPPTDDYDAPWEWKVQKVEKEFEKKFSVTEAPSLSALQQTQPQKSPELPSARRSSNVNADNNPQKQSTINPVPKPARTSSSSDPFQCRYQVDPTMPLQNQGWFHGAVRRGEAENLLRNQPDSSYLIRNSESSKLDYSLSLRNKGETMHLKITCRKSDGKYILGVNSRPYDTIPEMIHHYSMNKLNIRGAEHVKLEYPVFSENMYFTLEPGS